jgi:hypothetical protein
VTLQHNVRLPAPNDFRHFVQMQAVDFVQNIEACFFQKNSENPCFL